MITLKDFAERIMEPSVQALEARTGKTRQQLLAEYEAQLEPNRHLMREIRDNIMGDE